MASIITNNFRRNSVSLLVNSVRSTNEYYIGIGKSDSWPNDENGRSEDSSLFIPPIPNNSQIENFDALNNLIGLVKTNDATPLIPRNEWVAGRVYKQYDTTDPNLFNLTVDNGVERYPCYVTFSDKTYICLSNNDNAQSTSEIPSNYDDFKDTVNNTTIRETNDGYIWAYVQTLSTLPDEDFNTDSFISVKEELDENTQLTDIQNAKEATGGLIYGFVIENGGSGINPSDQITLVGRGEDNSVKSDILISDGSTSTPFSVTINSGEITELKITDLVGSKNILANYESASVIVDNHPEVIITPLIAPKEGFGFNARKDLPSFYAGISAKLQGDVENEIPTNISFRQVSLIRKVSRNILTFSDSTFTSNITGKSNTYYVDNSTGTIYTWNGSIFVVESGLSLSDIDNTGIVYGPSGAIDTLEFFTFDTSSNFNQLFETGSIITQIATGAKAFLDSVDLSNQKVFFHQNSSPSINLKKFDPNEQQIEIEQPNGTITSDNFLELSQSEYVFKTGSILFLENRKRIIRDSNQDENIKLVIQH